MESSRCQLHDGVLPKSGSERKEEDGAPVSIVAKERSGFPKSQKKQGVFTSASLDLKLHHSFNSDDDDYANFNAIDMVPKIKTK